MKETLAKFRSTQKETLNYIVNIPNKFAPALPVILYLHDFGERGSNIYDVKKSGIHSYTSILEIPYIIISPQCHFSYFWDYHLYSIELLMDEIHGLYDCDMKRVCIIGCGLGAYGGWNFLMQKPELFQGIISIGGGAMLKNNVNSILNKSSLIIHGEDDKTIPVSESKETYECLKAAKADTTLKLVKGAGHKLCTKIFEDKSIYDWMEIKI